MVRRPPSFCPFCGVELLTRRFDGRDRRFCPECEELVWVDAAAVAHVAVIDGDRVYLQKRAKEPGRGKWGFPAGFLEPDERPRDGGARELEEETSLQVAPSTLSLLDVGVDTGGEEFARRFLLGVSKGKTAGVVELDEEASEWGFFTPTAFDESTKRMSAKYRELLDVVAEASLPA